MGSGRMMRDVKGRVFWYVVIGKACVCVSECVCVSVCMCFVCVSE